LKSNPDTKPTQVRFAHFNLRCMNLGNRLDNGKAETSAWRIGITGAIKPSQHFFMLV